ncbi:Rid family hydrolase [Edaphobacter flagellatus]|uniref:Rid family hydrolase n=1 Tax=Edaphobacter flagellatus TaxID=1933044 RepID=UPI0021B333A0|nr:Rid family hydrolase [Edaphobacter flagellatus]
MRKILLSAALIAATMSSAAFAQSGAVKRVGDAKSLFSSAVWVGDTLYLSGTMAPVDYQPDKAKGTPAGYNGDTKAQAIGALKAIEKQLQSQGLGLGDIVQMQAYLTGDPAKGGEMDVEGWNEAYKQFFGTAEQPNKPVRATVQVAKLVLPTGRIEIMVIAAKPHSAK